MIQILNIKALASVQDLGRYGWRRYGIGHAGAMDTLALRAGNALLDNPDDAAAIEITLGFMQVRFEQDTPFCITGAFYLADLDNLPVHSYWRYTAKRGQVLTLHRAVQGMYGYLCVQGGFDVPQVLGSRSTDLKAALGGLEGRYLKTNDKLATCGTEKVLSRIGIAPIDMAIRIHALPSSEYNAFNRTAHYRFWQDTWTLQSDSNRMGYRLSGSALSMTEPIEMLSHAVQFGTVQVPPNGLPIILMADTQTTGGYPKIASIAQADLGRLAQVRFGGKIRFQMIDEPTAHHLLKKDEIYLHQIRKIAHAHRLEC